MTLKTSSKLTLAISRVASACAVQGTNKKTVSIWHHAASIQIGKKIQHHSMYITHHMKVKRIGLIRYSPQHFMPDWPDSVSGDGLRIGW
jgi:hypothetical protein